jgi:outer membrane protein OmpA-like peptidoglycan-associated protein
MNYTKMKNVFGSLLLFSAVVAFPFFGYSQADLTEANKLYTKLAYADAIPKYKKVISRDSSSVTAKTRLADCYRLTGNYREAEKWYASISTASSATDLDRFHYGQMLMNNGKYEDAKKWLQKSRHERPDDERAHNYLASLETIHRLFADSISYKVINIKANGSGNDFSPAYFNKGIVFTSSENNIPKSKTHAWTGESFTKLVYTESDATREPFANEVQIKFNNGPATFSAKQEMFNTINTLRVPNSKKDIYKLNIIISSFDGKKWSKPENFKYNSPHHNIAHPSLSVDGSTLYFSSDMPGGEGGMDLYFCERNESGWSDPVNLGNEINTPGNEIFPFIHDDGTLYFASNGHEGIGGLDVYMTAKAKTWQKPAALPYPVNTRHDDFGFILNNEKRAGYFSSNRPGGKGGDDIYEFQFSPSELKGIAINKDSGKPVPYAVITASDSENRTITITCDSLGKFTAAIYPCRDYTVTAASDDYASIIKHEFKSSCTSTDAGYMEMVFNNPLLTFEVLDKYSAAKISGVTVEIRDAETRQMVGTGDAETIKQSIDPCKEYVIVASKSGLPEVKTYFKTACVAKDQVVKISMGLPPIDKLFAGGIVYDQETKKTLDSVAVVIYDTKNIPLATITSSSEGTFGITGFKNIDRMIFFRNGYFSVTRKFTEGMDRKNIIIEMPALKLDRIIQLEGIFYDLGKSNIRPDAARVLDVVVEVLNENPSLEIELGAHTDARGNDESNLALSDKRAKAAAAYIIGKGIAESRIIGRGYGETVLKNKCLNNVKCSEKDHQENRRTEVKITKY